MVYFILILILIIGGPYLYWRYTSVVNKRDFFTSHLVVSIVGNLIILSIAVGIVNFSSPQEVLSDDDEALHKYETDTTYNALANKSLFEHYEQLNHLCRHNQEKLVTAQYIRLGLSDDSLKRSIAHFAFGLMAYHEDALDHAIDHFSKISDKSLPIVNYCMGKTYLELHDTTQAIHSFSQELTVPDGLQKSSLNKLISVFKERRDFNSFEKLSESYPEATELAPSFTRMLHWTNGDITHYILWTFKSISMETSMEGILAAVLIALVWLIYLSGLNAFAKTNAIKVGVMFLLGVVYIPLIFAFLDYKDSNIAWQLNDSFWNDFVYSVLMIGVPEELTKAAPLFLLLLLGVRFKEPIDYVICASASALGFAFLENILYFNELNPGIIHGRAYLAVLGHMMDSSFVAYGFIIGWFKRSNKKAIWYTLPIGFLAAAVTHGIYDVLLFHNYIFFFLIFFVFTVQIWIIVINNCLNNSPQFAYERIRGFNGSRLFISCALTTIFAFEYVISSTITGASAAHDQFLANIPFGGLMIIFFSSNLSSFDLVPGYWRDVYFSSREKRGYGTIPRSSVFFRWYLVNSIQAHNYVGLQVVLSNDTYNKVLIDYMPEPLTGTVIDRVTLMEEKDYDPHWFLIKLDSPIPFPADNNEYVLVKHRYQKDSLTDGAEVHAFFKAIPDLALFDTWPMRKEDFPFYGWVNWSIIDQRNYQ